MTYKLVCTMTHRTFDQPLTHTFSYRGRSKYDILAQIDTLPHHLENLDRHGRTAFKDARGVKHSWKLTLMPEGN